jgi:hypothetical protein
MKTTLQENRDTIGTWSVFHPVNAQDTAVMAAVRAIVEPNIVQPNKGHLQGTAARVPFDDIMDRVAPREGVTYETTSHNLRPPNWCGRILTVTMRPIHSPLHSMPTWPSSLRSVSM